MEELIRRENILLDMEVNDWKEAIKAAGSLLVETGNITKVYIDEMINSVLEMGPYIVLTKGFAMAHAAPSPEVINTATSIITLKKPVSFGSPNDPVSIVMCVSCVDKEGHMAYLQRVARVLMQKGIIEKMKNCKTIDEMYLLLNDRKEEEI